MPMLRWLRPGTKFRLAEMPEVSGMLLKVNDCRAVVKLDRPERDVEFEDATGQTRQFRCRATHVTSWAPTTVVEAVGFETIRDEEHAMATKTKRAKETPTTTKARVAKARVDAKPKGRTPKATASESKPAQATPVLASAPSASKMSCLDAAARVLQEAGEAMSTAQMIEAMATKGYWTSPGGKTPAATLYSAILRELKKTDGCRFRKTDKGRFALA